MRVFTEIDSLPAFRNPIVTVGSFDGVHLGHGYLLEMMLQQARFTDGETIVVTFAQHPRTVLQSEGELKLLTTLEEKLLLLQNSGVDNLIVMPFNAEVSRLSPEDFLKDFLIGKLGAKKLVVGYNHHFGHNKQGNAATLRQLEKRYGFEIDEAAKFDEGGEKISSTSIRDIIRKGDMEHAARLLGHPYIILADVNRDGNVTIGDPLKLLPPVGDYKVSANGSDAFLSIRENNSISLFPAVSGRVLINF